MIKFRAIIKATGEEFEPYSIHKNGCIQSGEGVCVPQNAILMIGVQIGDRWHFENDLYTDGHGKYFQLASFIGGWSLSTINYGMPGQIGSIDTLKKVGHLWTQNEKIRQLVKEYDPPVYSCLENIGRFSEVMK